jgi:ribosomal protein S18 acetylase RimI-like enzyme
MDREQLRGLAHKGMAIGPSPFLRHQKRGEHQFREGVAFTRQDLPGPGFNFAAVLGEAPPLDRIVKLCREFFAGGAGGYGVLVEADAGHPVEGEMQSRGWPIAEDEPALVLPSLPETFAQPPNLDIRRVSNGSDLSTFLETLSEAFGTSRDIPETFWTGSCLGDPDLAFFVGYSQGVPVSTSVFGRLDHIATIHGVSTVPAYRQRGFGRALTWAAARAGAELGCTVATLRAMGVSFDMYRKMGFVPVCNHRTYTVPV